MTGLNSDPACVTDAEDAADERRELSMCPYLVGELCQAVDDLYLPCASYRRLICDSRGWRQCLFAGRVER